MQTGRPIDPRMPEAAGLFAYPLWAPLMLRTLVVAWYIVRRRVASRSNKLHALEGQTDLPEPIMVEVTLEGVFSVTGRGRFALISAVGPPVWRDRMRGSMDGYNIVVADIGPRVIDDDGNPRLDVCVIQFESPIDPSEIPAGSQMRLVLQTPG
jgi:hypothetical protein